MCPFCRLVPGDRSCLVGGTALCGYCFGVFQKLKGDAYPVLERKLLELERKEGELRARIARETTLR